MRLNLGLGTSAASRSESLYRGHRSGRRRGLGKPGLVDDIGCQSAVNDTQRSAHQLRIAVYTGEQETQLKRKTQHPLTDGLAREYVIHQESGTFRHLPSTKAEAKSAPLATESDQVLVLTGFATYA